MMLGKVFPWRAKLFLFLLGGLLFCFQIPMVSNCGAECFYFDGTMTAELSVTRTLSYQIFGTAGNFTYRHYHPSAFIYNTNTQENNSAAPSFSANPPNWQSSDTDDFGNSYTDYIWNSLSNTVLNITFTKSVTTTADFGPFDSGDPFPVNQGTIPMEYLQSTDLVQANNYSIKSQAEGLVQDCTYQYEAVEKIIKWIINNIEYDINVKSDPSDALSTLTHGDGVCTGFSHLACAMLRAVGIPARYVSGFSIERPYSWQFGNTQYTADWNSGPHAWIEVYYPEFGWIPYDPQRDIHHVDAFRIKNGHGHDNDSFPFISWRGLAQVEQIGSSSSTVNIQNDVVNINCLGKTDDIDPGTYALSLEVTPSILPPDLNSITSPTNQSIIVVSGQAEAGSLVEIFVNDTSAGTVTATSNGNFSLSGVHLSKGNNSIYARATLGGMTSPSSSTITVVLKTQSSGGQSGGSGFYNPWLWGYNLLGGFNYNPFAGSFFGYNPFMSFGFSPLTGFGYPGFTNQYPGFGPLPGFGYPGFTNQYPGFGPLPGFGYPGFTNQYPGFGPLPGFRRLLTG